MFHNFSHYGDFLALDIIFFKLGFTQWKAEQPLRGMKLQEKEAEKKRLKHTGNLFRKNLYVKGVS